MLENVKAHLRGLGFAPTGRVKTITTMLDKLRRTRGMELSRMQDVAGARIVVTNIATQDEAKDAIAEFYGKQSCECREVDRRKDPRFGYRAVHLIIRIDGILVEVQIRTDLQDTWAQIVERLADRWGRGIRYGEEPEHPDGLVRSDEFVVSRREAMSTLMSLSDEIAATERLRQEVDSTQSKRQEFDARLQSVLNSQIEQGALVQTVSGEPLQEWQELKDFLARPSEHLDDEVAALLGTEVDLSVAQVLRVLETFSALAGRDLDAVSIELSIAEQQLRDRLRLIAEATDEESGQ